MSNRKIKSERFALFVGPIPPPITGQALAFRRVMDGYEGSKILVNQNLEGMSPIRAALSALVAATKAAQAFTLNRVTICYFTCSRSKKGALKDVYLLALCRIFRIRAICHVHGADLPEFISSLGRMYRHILLGLYSNVGVFITLTETMKDDLQRCLPGAKITTVENFYPECLEFTVSKKPTEHLNLVYLSNIIFSKGIFDLIAALKILKDEKIKLRIAGEFMGDEHMTAEEIALMFFEKIEGQTNITYCGVVDGMEKRTLLEGSDVLVLPTFYKTEAFPISIIEGMRTGNAIIATNHNYLPEIVTAENGKLVEPRSTDELALAILALQDDRKHLESIQRHNVIHAKKHYSPSIFQSKMKEIFKAASRG